MKILVIFLALGCFLTSGKVLAAKRCALFNAENHEIIGDDSEPTYYKLPSEAELTSAEFQEMKKFLLKAITQHNKLSRRNAVFSIGPLVGYGVQYKVTIRQRGEKEIWINGFCKGSGNMYSSADLTSIPVIVLDGGSCYFNTSINLKKHKANKIVIHGFA